MQAHFVASNLITILIPIVTESYILLPPNVPRYFSLWISHVFPRHSHTSTEVINVSATISKQQGQKTKESDEQRQNNRSSSDKKIKTKPIPAKTILQIAVCGTLIWSTLRILMHFFQFTPYGAYIFARPFLGKAHENSYAGLAVGVVMLFLIIFVACLVYSFVLGNLYNWWLGVLYGIAFFYVFGYFFRMRHWGWGVWSTEFFWFMSLGMFIGMSIVAERFDTEETSKNEVDQ
nr:YqhR family membrane protein [Brevibacillus laterosporus]